MSQRNPMNDRYNAEGKKGQTRKSAAKAKPKSKAAASVHVQRTELTKKEKKKVRKAEENKDRSLEREAYSVPTDEYKRLRRIWFGILGLGVALLAASLFIQFQMPDMKEVSIGIIVLAYVAVIGAFIFDKVKINKLRKAYKEELRDTKSKEARAQAKAQKAEERSKEDQPSVDEMIEQVPTVGNRIAGALKSTFGQSRSNNKSAAEALPDSESEEAEKIEEKA